MYLVSDPEIMCFDYMSPADYGVHIFFYMTCACISGFRPGLSYHLYDSDFLGLKYCISD